MRTYMYHYFQNTVNISDFAFKAGVINGTLYVLAQHQLLESLQNSISSSCNFKSSEYQGGNLPRRLVSSESEQTTFNSGSGKMSQSSSFTRFHNKQSKIMSSSKSENNIFRGNISPGFEHSDTNNRENRKIESSIRKVMLGTQSSKRFSSSTCIGDNGLMHRFNTKCSSIYETNSTSPVKFLETSFSKIRCEHSIYSTSKISSQLVKKWSKHTERPTFSTNKNQYNHNDRCFEIGLRRFYGEPSISGYLVIQPEQVTHWLELKVVYLRVNHFH